MSLTIARKIVELIRQDKESEIKETLDPYSLEFRQCVTSINYKRSSLLFIAVANQCVTIVTYLLESCGSDPNSFGWIDGEKLSCLAMAIDINSETIVDILLAHGADPEVVSSYERTALFYACTDNRQNIVQMLIEHGANVNSRNYAGETPLTESTDNSNIFKYLISKGTDINSVDDYGQTALMLGFEIERDEIIYFLLGYEDINVRLKNDYGEDALHLAVRYSSDDIIEEIIKKGCYTNCEIIQVYELESCLYRVGKEEQKARELWQEALKMRSKPTDTPMFENQNFTGKLLKIAGVLNAEDFSALSYLESINGLNNLFTLGAYARAVCNVRDENKYITSSEFFFDTLHSLNDRLFFKGFGQCVALIRHHFDSILSDNTLNLAKIFDMFVSFIENICLRFKNMTPQQRTPHANKLECLLYFTVELFCKIDERHPREMSLFFEGIRRVLKTDLRGLQQKPLIQMCGSLNGSYRIVKCFIRCGANVNSRDTEGKTIVHEVIESEMPTREKIINKIINEGFDFNRVRCDEYCLQCRMEKENIIPQPVKYTSLQCLSARTICEKTLYCSYDVPRHLTTIINSHFFLA